LDDGSNYSAYTFYIINIRSAGVMPTILAIGALAILVAGEALVVAFTILLRAACFLTVATLA